MLLDFTDAYVLLCKNMGALVDMFSSISESTKTRSNCHPLHRENRINEKASKPLIWVCMHVLMLFLAFICMPVCSTLLYMATYESKVLQSNCRASF